tara:strand:+ start:497 stop:931 length:435 start_codon:yes stop_codon:yes gene_type:complete
MNKLDPHTLFSIFEKGDEEVYKEHGAEDLLDNPFVLMGMVTRGLESYEMMRMLYLKNYPKEFIKAEPIIKRKYYNRLYSYLLRINLNSIEDIYTIGDSYDKSSTSNALNTLRQYFESTEEYEKCQKIVPYIQMLVLEEAKNLIK